MSNEGKLVTSNMPNTGNDGEELLCLNVIDSPKTPNTYYSIIVFFIWVYATNLRLLRPSSVSPQDIWV